MPSCFCAFSKLSFSLLSQVFSLSSALLTAHKLFGVSHVYIFFCHPCPYTKKTVSSEKHPKSPRISLICLVTLLLFFSFFPLNFYVMCFRFPAFLGGDVTLWIWSLYLILMDSCGFWAVTRERFYIKPSLWSWEILRRTLQLCSPKKNCISHAAFVCSTNIQTAGLLSCFGSCIVIDLSAPLVAMAPWTRKTASGPRLCRTSRPAASQRFSGSWR